MTFEEYQQGGRARYLALVEAIQNILRHALSQHGMVSHGITGRAKELSSLRKKLGDREFALDQPMDEVKDLAGCRVVFLTNSQVEVFNSTGALHENFEVLSVNVHHPVPGTDTETKLFDSTNYLVQLKPDRLALPEYREFEGLRAEIQIQTLLNHAWAEMGHDTIYKEPRLIHLGAAQMKKIGERMNKVMQDHLIPAGYDFDKIAQDFQRLMKADGAAAATIEAIESVDNNNDLEDALETYTDLVLPHFDEPTEEFSKRLGTLIDAAERARDYALQAVVTEFGEYQGKTSMDIARRVATLIKAYRYFEPERTFHAVVRLYEGARDDEEQRLWVEVGEELAEHNLDIWKRYGPIAQQVILDQLEQLDAGKIASVKSLLIAMLSHLLSADLGGTTWRSDSVTIHRGAVHASDELRQLRSRAIDWLEQWLDAAETDAERLTILNALGKAGAMPMRAESDPGLFLMLLEDGTRVAEITLARISRWALELRRSREVDALHTHHRFQRLPPDLAENTELIAAQKKFIDAILALRDRLAADDDYVCYKTLIGYDSVRPNAWEGDHFDHEATDVWRREQYPRIVANVTIEKVPAWKARIDAYVGGVGHDGGNFTPMREFLGLLAEQKPDVALHMLGEVSDKFAVFVPAMLSGLERAGRMGEVLTLVDGWMAEGQLLRAVGNYLHQKPEIDIERLQTLVVKVFEREDLVSGVNAATTAAAWYSRAANPTLIETVLMPVVRFANERQLPHWVDHFFAPGNALIVQDLSEAEAAELLKSFVGIADVDYREARLLVAVSQRHPQLVIDFFGARLRQEHAESGERFQAIPFDSHDLEEAFSPHLDLLLPAVREWYEEEPQLHEYRGGRLLKHAFPELTNEVADRLITLARQGGEQDFKFILKTLSPHEGAEQLYPILMEVVDRLEPGDKLLNEVSCVLGETGVVSGAFGFVQVTEQRRNLIERYRDDPRPRVQAYARDRARELTQEMAWEQRRAVRSVAQRRRNWNEE
ncbi:RelA/SpoT domain-containing protein [Labrenzia sp. 011]|uniref:RelA/SpoT domain-containing protein n=1 Tax=Labrenzia sp. 011 TaxID=2171494 RepID=UPI000D523643|nr:RelA/SpoT domain-containing protein [Labrenzia sp. 011]PVB62046.1 hypothetical protein DCO57_09185 [Labrenzia sp. 011]